MRGRKLFYLGMFATVCSNAQQASPPATARPAAALATVGRPAAPTHYLPNHLSRREEAFYQSVWGIDNLSVKAVESGELIRFAYTVVDTERSKPLNDKKLEPALIFPAGRVKLTIPSLEKVGQLRQSSTQEPGRSYWMAFSNPQRTVKRGDRVDIVIGNFHAQGLVVE